MAKAKKRKTTTSKKNSTTKSVNSLDKMKYEIANEFGVSLGANSSSRDNGKVGGEITKRLVERSKNNKTNYSSTTSKKRDKKSK